MVDVKKLEKQWVKYKIKQYLPYAVLGVSSLIILVVLISLNATKEEISHPKTTQKKASEPIQKESLATVEEKKSSPLPTKEIKQPAPSQVQTQITQTQTQVQQQTQPIQPTPIAKKESYTPQRLEPNLTFIKKLKDTPLYTQSYSEPSTQEVSREDYSSSMTQKKPKKEPISQPKEEKKSSIVITTKKTSQQVREKIEQRFKKTNNPVLSLFLAREYYKLGDYKKAYNYALITNKIDSTIEDSWIIFAKSLVKLKQKKKALEALEAYIKTSHSKKAQVLAEQIRSGKFQ